MDAGLMRLWWYNCSSMSKDCRTGEKAQLSLGAIGKIDIYNFKTLTSSFCSLDYEILCWLHGKYSEYHFISVYTYLTFYLLGIEFLGNHFGRKWFLKRHPSKSNAGKVRSQFPSTNPPYIHHCSIIRYIHYSPLYYELLGIQYKVDKQDFRENVVLFNVLFRIYVWTGLRLSHWWW